MVLLYVTLEESQVEKVSFGFQLRVREIEHKGVAIYWVCNVWEHTPGLPELPRPICINRKLVSGAGPGNKPRHTNVGSVS